RHTRSKRDWSSDVCSSDLALSPPGHSGGGPLEEWGFAAPPSPPRKTGNESAGPPPQCRFGGGLPGASALLAKRAGVSDNSGEGRSEERRVGKEGGMRWAPC